MSLTYSNYLHLDQLLSAQHPQSAEHDEMLFVIIHQAYELWFKQILHEADYTQEMLRQKDAPRTLHTLRRILTILKVLVAQLDILETMTPLEFLTFRDRLESASGFQSYQFRELEFLLGAKRRSAIHYFPENSMARTTLEARYHQPTLWDAFLHYLAGQQYPVPAELLTRDVTRPVEPSPQLQAILVNVYRNDFATGRICERLVDLDEGVQEWRYRHVKMVERTIGNKKGTGGSSGVDYLNSTLHRPVFPDLWAIRTAF